MTEMINFKLTYTSTFIKSIKKLKDNRELIQKITKKLEMLSRNPEIGKPLKYPLSGYWSIKIGKFRIIYRIDMSNKQVILVAFGHRKNIYNNILKF